LLKFLLERASVTGLPADRNGGSVAAFDPPVHAADAPTGLSSRRTWATSSPQATARAGLSWIHSPGLYESVLVLDYKSLYPSIIRSFLIDPCGPGGGHQRRRSRYRARLPGVRNFRV
jgi:DNA polymerase-2